MMPLGLLGPGEQGEIVSIRAMHAWEKNHQCCGNCNGERHKKDFRLEDLGLRVGKIVQMLTNGSPVLLKVDESRIAVDRGLAMKIMIRR
ncbi:MAG: FeoA family protein [Desulfuromonadales bacterium]